MQNHDEKITDVIRSVLPGTARRDARATRRLIYRAARRTVRAALRSGDVDPFVDVRGRIGDMVWNRRAADKVGPLVRWALHRVRHDPRLRDASLCERLDHFRQLLPDNTIGRHALSHIAWPLERLDAQLKQLARRGSDDRALVRALFEAGYHRELNARLKTQLLPLLAGARHRSFRFDRRHRHDVDREGTCGGGRHPPVASFPGCTGSVRCWNGRTAAGADDEASRSRARRHAPGAVRGHRRGERCPSCDVVASSTSSFEMSTRCARLRQPRLRLLVDRSG